MDKNPHFPNPSKFKIETKGETVEAVLCFQYNDGVPFTFMDKIADLVILEYQLLKYITQGDPTPADRIIYLFDKKFEGLLKDYDESERNLNPPNVLARIFDRKKWRKYRERDIKRSGLYINMKDAISVEIYTDHDYPFISIYSKIHNEKQIEELILNVSRQEGFNFQREP